MESRLKFIPLQNISVVFPLADNDWIFIFEWTSPLMLLPGWI